MGRAFVCAGLDAVVCTSEALTGLVGASSWRICLRSTGTAVAAGSDGAGMVAGYFWVAWNSRILAAVRITMIVAVLRLAQRLPQNRSSEMTFLLAAEFRPHCMNFGVAESTENVDAPVLCGYAPDGVATVPGRDVQWTAWIPGSPIAAVRVWLDPLAGGC